MSTSSPSTDEGQPTHAPATDGGYAERAQILLIATSYFEDLGLHELARHARVVARDTLELVGQLEAERSARVALQATNGRLEALLLRRSAAEAA